MRECYAYGIRLDGQHWWLLWFAEAQDSTTPQPGGVLTEEGRVLAFSSRGAAEFFGLRQGWLVKPPWRGQEPPLLRLDRVARWVQAPSKTLDDPLFLDSWNLLLDVTRSVGAEDNLVVVQYRRMAENDVYDQLFFGSNLPVITRDGPRYRRRWSGAEVVALRDTLNDGITLLRRVMRLVDLDAATL